MLLHPGSLCASGGAEASCPVKLSFSVGSHSKSRCTRFPDRKFLGKFMESPTKSSVALQAICYMRSSYSPESWHNFELVFKNLAKLCSASLFVQELQINQQCFACWFMLCWAPGPGQLSVPTRVYQNAWKSKFQGGSLPKYVVLPN